MRQPRPCWGLSWRRARGSSTGGAARVSNVWCNFEQNSPRTFAIQNPLADTTHPCRIVELASRPIPSDYLLRRRRLRAKGRATRRRATRQEIRIHTRTQRRRAASRKRRRRRRARRAAAPRPCRNRCRASPRPTRAYIVETAASRNPWNARSAPASRSMMKNQGSRRSPAIRLMRPVYVENQAPVKTVPCDAIRASTKPSSLPLMRFSARRTSFDGHFPGP